MKRTSVAGLEPYAPPDRVRSQLARYQETFELPFGADVTLHPRQLVLGATLEYVQMPLDLTAEVLGKSSWGRAGLIIATATIIHPGYTGVITLELENLGEAPVTLKVGCAIGQLVFSTLEGPRPADYKDAYGGSRYVGVTQPVIGRLGGREEQFVLDNLATSRAQAIKQLAQTTTGTRTRPGRS